MRDNPSRGRGLRGDHLHRVGPARVVEVSPPDASSPDGAGSDDGNTSATRVCVPVSYGGRIGPGWGRADRLAIADVAAGRITGWREFDVGWGDAHDTRTAGAHHAAVVRFLRDQHVDVVVARNMGASMRNTLDKLGLRVRLAASGNARTAVRVAAATSSTPAVPPRSLPQRPQAARQGAT